MGSSLSFPLPTTPPPLGILISYVNIWGDVALCCRGWVRSPPFSLACVKNLKRRREGKKKKKHDLAASLVVCLWKKTSLSCGDEATFTVGSVT